MQQLADQLLDYISPFVVHAGQYALNVQNRIGKKPPKNGWDDPFSAALTDADLSVQGFIEGALLARYPQIAFFGEEHESSLNMKYFTKETPLTVFLDPIDGTRFFQDNLDNFNVILTIADRQRILGAACYVPGHDKFFRRSADSRTTVASGGDAISGRGGAALDIHANPPVAVTYDQQEYCIPLSQRFEIVNIAQAYRSDAPCLSINSMLLGQSSVIVGGRRSGLIDWGALAFLAEGAGAVVTDREGKALPPLDELGGIYLPGLLVCRDSAVQNEVLSLLSTAGR